MKLNEKSSSDIVKVFINGVIYSIDEKSSIYEAMAIKEGKIVALGTNDEISNYFIDKKEIIDLKSRTVLPGFIDAHCNMSERDIMKKGDLSLFQCNNITEYLIYIQNYIDTHPEEKVIYGIGWKNSIFEKNGEELNCYSEVFKGPNKKWLDKIETDKPIVLKSCDGHSLWLSSKAFEYFKITPNTNVPSGGRIELDEQNQLWGTLKENAACLVNIDWIDKYEEKDYIDNFIKYQKFQHSQGVTTIGLIDTKEVKMPLELYGKLENMKELKLRIVYGVTILSKKLCKRSVNEQLHELKRNRIIYSTELFLVSVAKFFSDGIVENMTAFLFKPYTLLDDKCNERQGLFLWDINELKEGIKMANRLEFNVCIHTKGDLACKFAIDGIEYSIINNQNKTFRNSLIHVDLITQYYIRKMKVLKINAIIEPCWFYRSMSLSKNEVLAIGKERAYRQYPVKSLVDLGVITAATSDDNTSVKINPLEAIECATVRNLYDFLPSGYPEIINMNDVKYRLNPRERISIDEAIKMFTINAAYVLGKEKEIGSLEIGKKADFIVLDKDIVWINPLDIGNINIDRTYFNGELVYLNE
ncbi:amidohydrolase [Clostridium saccharoperbutylacetonicum]|uniref:amidohydrolase n=1 Tax=Clostridium saccharoperbutylacetonicum TaxID=36745 RepID=UPI0039E9413B